LLKWSVLFAVGDNAELIWRCLGGDNERWKTDRAIDIS